MGGRKCLVPEVLLDDKETSDIFPGLYVSRPTTLVSFLSSTDIHSLQTTEIGWIKALRIKWHLCGLRLEFNSVRRWTTVPWLIYEFAVFLECITTSSTKICRTRMSANRRIINLWNSAETIVPEVEGTAAIVGVAAANLFVSVVLVDIEALEARNHWQYRGCRQSNVEDDCEANRGWYGVEIYTVAWPSCYRKQPSSQLKWKSCYKWRCLLSIRGQHLCRKVGKLLF